MADIFCSTCRPRVPATVTHREHRKDRTLTVTCTCPKCKETAKYVWETDKHGRKKLILRPATVGDR